LAREKLRELLDGRPVDVLLGGFSNEREVSLVSGGAVADALEGAGHAVRRVDVSEAFPEKGRDILAGTGLVFVMLHGRFGEDGEVQQLLEEWDLPYTGSGPVASRAAMDKVQSKEVFERKGICTPPWGVYGRDMSPDEIVAQYGLPLVVKPAASGSSIGVSIVGEAADVEGALREAERHGGPVVLEEFIAGRELTVGVLGAEALPLVELVPKREFYDYDAKYSDDAGTEYVCPAVLDEKLCESVQAEGLAAHRALGCRGFSRVDVRLSEEGRCFVLEANTIPGFTSHSLLPKAAAARGISFSELVERIAEMALCGSDGRASGDGGE
jgi:D-alanine-D-alanine ligase